MPQTDQHLPHNVLRRGRLKPWHEELIDYMILYPKATQGEMAAHYGKTQAWVSLIINSDLFKSAYAKRRAEVRERVDGEITDRLGRVAVKALDHLEKELENTAKMNAKTANEIATNALTRLGYGVEKNPVPIPSQSVNVQINVDRAVVHEARERLRSDQIQRIEPTAGRGALRNGVADSVTAQTLEAPDAEPE